MTIEKMKKEDIPELVELYKQLTDCENTVEQSQAVFDKMSADGNYWLLVAKEDDEIVGSVLGIICYSIPLCATPFMVVEDVIVNDSHRRKGIGKILFEKLDEIAVENNCGYSILVSSGFRKGAHVFYENQGYTEAVKGFRKRY